MAFLIKSQNWNSTFEATAKCAAVWKDQMSVKRPISLGNYIFVYTLKYRLFSVFGVGF